MFVDHEGGVGGHLDERSLGELLVDLRLVHDVLGPAGVLQRAQGLLHKDTESESRPDLQTSTV